MSPSPFGSLPYAFTKMSGAGNDFLVFGARVEVGPRETEAIRRLCRRGTGVGADGVLFVFAERPGDPSSKIVADYVNADGSVGRFCGNGTRCAARFAVLRDLAGPSLVVVTGWGAVGATVRADRTVALALPEPIAVGRTVPSLDAAGETLEHDAFALVVGVPHVVLYVKADVDLDALDLSILGPLNRRHPALREGANANFVKVLSPARLAVRTWERGVEAETLACGSGVVASAIVTSFLKGGNPPVSVATRSGETLEVSFVRDGELARDVTLTGDARVVFEGTLEEDSGPGPC